MVHSRELRVTNNRLSETRKETPIYCTLCFSVVFTSVHSWEDRGKLLETICAVTKVKILYQRNQFLDENFRASWTSILYNQHVTQIEDFSSLCLFYLLLYIEIVLWYLKGRRSCVGCCGVKTEGAISRTCHG